VTRAAAKEAPEDQVPDPGAAASHSGRLLVRMPKSLHAELSRAAEREGSSLNAYIIGVLSASIAWRQPGADRPPDAQAPPPAYTRGTRALSLALVANLVVLAVAAAIAIALLVTAWRG
jgi:hypothetical protein